MNTLDPTDFRLLNDWQRALPMTPRPYAAMGIALGIGEDEVIGRLTRLKREGYISRVGAVFRPHLLGWSTLAAVAVAPERLEQAAARISAHPEVNHNYEREHAYNLWFVVAAASRSEVARVLERIGQETGGMPLDLPMLEDYHLDLGFDLRGHTHKGAPKPLGRTAALSDLDIRIAHGIEGGLELTPRPYAALAAASRQSEAAVVERIRRLIDSDAIRRFGVIVRHHELGYAANAMVVWDIPDGRAAEIGALLGAQAGVTLCYRRPRSLPTWPYNLFTMVHGRDRASVLETIAGLRRRLEPDVYANEVLFSLRRFKQCGARYRPGLDKAA